MPMSPQFYSETTMYKKAYLKLNQFSRKKIAEKNKRFFFIILLIVSSVPQNHAFAMSKATHHSKPIISCPSEFDEVECDSFQDGVRNGQLDEMTAIPNPFLEEAQDSAIHAMPYIRGYELIRGRKKK